MIQVTITQKEGKVISLVVEGHAETEEERDNIVCASVSVLAQTCLLGLDEIAKIHDMTFAMYDGYLELTLPEKLTKVKRSKADTILGTMLLGIKGIQELHPQYIEICEKEVRSDAY